MTDRQRTGASHDDAGAPIAVGAIARPHGVRGELRVHRFDPASTLLLEVDAVWLRSAPDEALARHGVVRARRHQDMVLLTLEGVEGRDAAEALRGHEVCVPRDAFPPADDDEFYHVDLIGLTATRPDGSEVGRVAEVLVYPSVDCLLVEEADGVREIPLVDPYVVEIDLEARTLVVDHVEDFELRRPKGRR